MPRPRTSHASRLVPSSTCSATSLRAARSRRACTCREVTNFPSFPAAGESLMRNSIASVGDSTFISRGGAGFSGSVRVSPISTSDRPPDRDQVARLDQVGLLAAHALEEEEAHGTRGHPPAAGADQQQALAAPDRSGLESSHGDAPRVRVDLHVAHGEVDGPVRIRARRRDVLEDRVEDGQEVGLEVVRRRAGDPLPTGGVEHGELELLLRRPEVDEEAVDEVEHLGGPGVAAVDLVHHEKRRQTGLARLAEHEACLRQRSLVGVHEEEHRVRHAQHALHLPAEVGVARGVDEVDLHAAVLDGAVLREDRDAALALELVRVHHQRLVLRQGGDGTGRHEEAVDQRGLAVVDVGHDGDVAEGEAHGGTRGKGRGGYPRGTGGTLLPP